MGEHANGKSESSGRVNSKRAPGEWPWWAQFFLALSAMALVALFLIGLPYYVVMAERSVNPGAAGAWAAMIPVLIGFTTMTISGIFVFMTFRIDRGAKAEARTAAEKIARDKVNDIIEKRIQSEMKEQWKGLLKDAKSDADISVRDVDERTKARYDASDERMEMKIISMDERIANRFADADARIKERVEDADAWIKERVTDAEKRIKEQVEDAERRIDQDAERRIKEWVAAQGKEPTGSSDAGDQENPR